MGQCVFFFKYIQEIHVVNKHRKINKLKFKFEMFF